MEEKKICCEGCKYIKPYAKANINGIEYGYMCTVNEKTFVDITEFIKLAVDSCIDFEEDKDNKLQLALEVKDIQKIAIQFESLNNKKEGE